MNPFKLLCFFGVHSWLEESCSKYWSQERKFVLVSHTKECVVCGKKVDVV